MVQLVAVGLLTASAAAAAAALLVCYCCSCGSIPVVLKDKLLKSRSETTSGSA
jgi:hypothetical protein